MLSHPTEILPPESLTFSYLSNKIQKPRLSPIVSIKIGVIYSKDSIRLVLFKEAIRLLSGRSLRSEWFLKRQVKGR